MKLVISGGGIAGLTTAIALQKIGIEAHVYEAAQEIKAVGAGIVLAANALKAFQKLEIEQTIMAEGRLLDSFSLKDEKGKVLTQNNSLSSTEKYGADNFTIHRADLHRVLQSFLKPGTIQTGKRCVDVESENDQARLHFSDGSSETADYLIAADGIHSPVRQKLLPTSKIRYADYTCWRSVIENPLPELKQASESWGRKGRFGIVPLAHNKLYWFACINAPQNDERMKRFTVEDLLANFSTYHDPIPEILKKTTNGELIWNDIADLRPLSQYAFGNILLIGDAAHATTPNMGQGACQAIEDAVILADEIQKAHSIPEAFRAFEKRRMEKTHYIINQSRMIGKMAHMQNPYFGALRNMLMRSMPKSIQEKQLEKVLKVDF
jgi:2-polyprenyl-6-methoxyphenol hydroxylase-like FAD-dependent oxidoreductase